MLYEIKFGKNAAEATKKIYYVKGAVNPSAVTK